MVPFSTILASFHFRPLVLHPSCALPQPTVDSPLLYSSPISVQTPHLRSPARPSAAPSHTYYPVKDTWSGVGAAPPPTNSLSARNLHTLDWPADDVRRADL